MPRLLSACGGENSLVTAYSVVVVVFFFSKRHDGGTQNRLLLANNVKFCNKRRPKKVNGVEAVSRRLSTYMMNGLSFLNHVQCRHAGRSVLHHNVHIRSHAGTPNLQHAMLITGALSC